MSGWNHFKTGNNCANSQMKASYTSWVEMAVRPEVTLTPTDRPLISVVLPIFNETEVLAKEIERTIAGLKAAGKAFEIIVVDDGSTDSPEPIVARYEGVRYVRHRRNLGSGAARKTGTLAALGDIVVWTDVDLTYPNDKIAELVDTLIEQEADQVVGARRTEEGTMRVLRTPAKWFIRALASFLAEFPIPDLNSGFRAFRKSVAEPYLPLLPRGFSCVSTITLAFLCNGHEVVYVPIDYRPRVGKSKFHPIKDAYKYILQVLRMIMYFNPIRVFMPAAILIGSVGFLKMLTDIYRYNWHIAPSTLMLVLTAIQLFALGMVADLVVRRVR